MAIPKISKKRKAPEAQLHRAVADFLKVTLPPTAFFTTFPLGGGGLAHGARQKRLGTATGFPDCIVLWGGCAYLIELKSAKGVVSADQTACHIALGRAGVPVCVARSVDEVEAFLAARGIPLRGWTTRRNLARSAAA